MSTEAKSKYVVVSTKSRRWLVVAGELVSQTPEQVTLRNARLIVWWGPEAHGLVGMAATGKGLRRVSPAVDEINVSGWETVLTASTDARTAIEAEPWH